MGDSTRIWLVVSIMLVTESLLFARNLPFISITLIAICVLWSVLFARGVFTLEEADGDNKTVI